MVAHPRDAQPGTIPNRYGRAITTTGPGWTASEREEVKIILRQWGVWVQNGRHVDPWASGAGKGIDYTVPRVMSSRTSYGPGRAADGTEGDAYLVFVESCIDQLRPDLAVMVRHRYVDGYSILKIAELQGRGRQWVDKQWVIIHHQLLIRLKGWQA